MTALWDLIVHQFTTCHDSHVLCPDCKGYGCRRCDLAGVVCPWREARRERRARRV